MDEVACFTRDVPLVALVKRLREEVATDVGQPVRVRLEMDAVRFSSRQRFKAVWVPRFQKANGRGNSNHLHATSVSQVALLVGHNPLFPAARR